MVQYINLAKKREIENQSVKYDDLIVPMIEAMKSEIKQIKKSKK